MLCRVTKQGQVLGLGIFGSAFELRSR